MVHNSSNTGSNTTGWRLLGILFGAVLLVAACTNSGTDAVSDTAPPSPAATASNDGAAQQAGAEAVDPEAEVLGATQDATTTNAPETTAPPTTVDSAPVEVAGADETAPPSATTTTAAPIVAVVNPPPPAPSSPPPPAPSAPIDTVPPQATTPGPSGPQPPAPPINDLPNLDLGDAIEVAITVTPSEQVTDQTLITVASTEWQPNRIVSVVQCVGVVGEQTGIDSCNINQVDLGNSNGAGDWSVTFRARRYVDLADGEHDCAIEPCFIGAGSVFEAPLTIGTHPISFDPNGVAPPLPTMTIAPATNLRHNQTVTATGAGFAPGDYVNASQCVADGSACRYLGSYERTGYVESHADSDGRVTIELTVTRYVGSEIGLFDCLTAPCELRFSTGDRDPLPVALAFDPSEPAPTRPSMSATPTSNLAADQEITVTIAGIDDYWRLSMCATGDFGSCVQLGSSNDVNGAAQSIQRVVTVHRLLIPEGSGDLVDCAVESCALRFVTNSYGGVVQDLELSFAGGGNITLPELSATPSTGLLDNQIITVTTNPIGTNLGYFNIAQCLVGQSQTCRDVASLYDETRSGWYWADAILTGDAQVRRQLPIWDQTSNSASLVDCAPAACELQMTANGRLLDAVPLSFDTTVPLPADPSITVEPSINLTDGQQVTAVVSNGGEWFTAYQCPTNEPRGNRCRWLEIYQLDDSPTTAETVRVRRLLTDQRGVTVDCGASNARCSVFLFDQYERQVDAVPLAFDPDAPLYPDPTMSVSVVEDLVDGQSVAITIAAIDVSARMWLCPAGATQFGVCDRLVDFRSGDFADGEATSDATVYRVVNRTHDCLEQSCEIVAQLRQQHGPYTETLLRQAVTFDPTAPLAPGPSLTYSATTGLRDGDVITVTGENFRAGTVITAFCADPIPVGAQVAGRWNCYSTGADPEIAEVVDGTFETTVTVHATFDNSFDDDGPTDCRDVNCYIVVARYYDTQLPVLLSEPLRFVPASLTAEQGAADRVAELTTTRIVEGQPVTGEKVPAPAEPAPTVIPNTSALPPAVEPPADPLDELRTDRATGYFS